VDAYPFDERVKQGRPKNQAVVELAVDYSVPDIADLVIRVEHMQGEDHLETVWSDS